ncbi:TatD family hydrolase [Thermogladius sp. 4427co]|uniref:TatD family hydrolase n=1 Tax=Thermogladius sp. 4427co TaxID=3450718 RepID=UPI003F79DB89
MKVKFSDAHMHLNPVKGMGAARVSDRLVKEGFWFIALVSLPPYHYGFEYIGIESYEKALEILVREARHLREKGLRVSVFAGFHPAEIDEYEKKGINIREIYELAEKVLSLIEKKIREGEIDGIGEVGRQHYGTSYSRISLSELIMIKSMELAKDLNVPVHLHLDQSGWSLCRLVSKIAELVGVRKELLLIHHASKSTAISCTGESLYVSIPVKNLQEYIVDIKARALVESDFIDDNTRPGVAAYPWEIPRIARSLVNSGVLDEDTLYKIMVDNIVEFYRVESP